MPSLCLHEAVLDRPRTDARKDVAAVLTVADFGFVDDDLQEQIVDVRVIALRATDDGDFARERMRTADAIDLTHVRRAHRREQHAIARLAIGGRSFASKYKPFDVPPRMSVQGMAVSIARSGGWTLGAGLWPEPL